MIGKTAWAILILGAVGLAGCSAETSAPLAPEPPAQSGVTQEFEGTYDGSWTVFIEASQERRDTLDRRFLLVESAEGSCSGSVTLQRRSVRDRLFGQTFDGSYLMLDDGDCTADGATVSGEVQNGNLREDGGVNFGLVIPGSDGNFFEDVLAGSGVRLPTLLPLGCAILNKDIDNQMDGSILAGRLSAVASASLDCPDPGGDIRLKMLITVDATK